MTEERNSQDLKERLELIESMIREGRQTTESWGWTFVLWGVALYVAIVWASWGQKLSLWGDNLLAWPVTMIVAIVVMMAIAMGKIKGKHTTTAGHTIASVWAAVGFTMLVLFPALSIAGKLGQHSFAALMAALLGIANGASGMILRWKAQFACAVVWWATAVASCFTSGGTLTTVLLSAIFICQIAFGTYAMILDSRRRRQVGEAHA